MRPFEQLCELVFPDALYGTDAIPDDNGVALAVRALTAAAAPPF
jgi:hypothetical protein